MLEFCLLDTCLSKYHDLDVPIEKPQEGKTNGIASGEKPREENVYRDVGGGNYFLMVGVK